MLAMIGFIVLLLIGLCCLYGFFAGTAFGASGAEMMFTLVVGVLAFWAAFHYAPFHITFTQ